MDRERHIRETFAERHPETLFLRLPPNPAGFAFGALENGKRGLAPVVHAFALFDRTAGMEDAEFLLCVEALCTLAEMAQVATNGDAARMTPAVWDRLMDMLAEEDPPAWSAVSETFNVN